MCIVAKVTAIMLDGSERRYLGMCRGVLLQE